MKARIEAIREPHFAHRLRQKVLTVLGLLSGDVIRAGGECIRRDGWFAFLSFPDAGDAEEIGVEAGPEVVAEVQDEAARREIVLGKVFTDLAGIEHAAEERKILLHKVTPRRRRGMCVGLLSDERGGEGEEREKRTKFHDETEQARGA